MTNIKYMNIKEFREEGYLQEANRLFFHPLGLALEVVIDENNNESLGGIHDYRKDPEGTVYGNGIIKQYKIDNVSKLREAKREYREKLLGNIIQSPDKEIDYSMITKTNY